MGCGLRPAIRIAALVLAALALPSAAAAKTAADYGDAPDGARAGYLSKPHVVGHFPSKPGSNGAHHTANGLLRLGGKFDLEGDSLQVNKDLDDDGMTAALKPCRKGTVSFVVNALDLPASLRAAGHTAYLNAWFDWNQDGRWKAASRCGRKTVPEWRVQNFRVDLAKFADDPIQIIRVPVLAGPQVADVWMRGTLTLDQRVTSPAGKGAFKDGETEDYLYHGTGLPPSSGKKKKKKPVDDDPNRRVIPFCAPIFIDHGKAGRVDIFFWDPDFGPLLFPDAGTMSTVENGKTLPPPPGDVQVSSFQFGANVKSTLTDDRAFPIELVTLTFHVTGPHITGLDQILSCDVLILHSWHPGGPPGGGPPTPVTPPPPATSPQPPVAAFTFQPNNPPSGPKVGQTVTFDGSGSSDPDGTIVSYDWDFGNGAHGTGQFPGTQYLKPDVYTVTLTVTDDGGNKTTTTQKVYVSGPGSKPATISDIPCSGASGGYVDINIPTYAQNPTATLTSALTGCTGLSITNVRVTFVQGSAPGLPAEDAWHQPENHLHIDFDLTGASGDAGPGSATFTATWQ